MLVEVAFLFVSFLVLQMVFKNRIRSKISSPETHRAKFSFYSVYGILRRALSDSGRGWIWEHLHSDFLQIISGTSALFPAESVIDVSLGLTHFVLLTKANAVEEFIMSRGSSFRLGTELFVPWFGNSFTISNGTEWKSRKNLVMPVIRNSALQAQVEKFDEHSKVLIGILKNRQNEEWIDVRNLMELCSADCACDMALGISTRAQIQNDARFVAAMRRTTKTMMKRMFNPFLRSDFIFWKTTLARQFRKDICYLRGFIQEAIQERKAASRTGKRGENFCPNHSKATDDDLLNVLLHAHRQNPDFTESDITDEIAAFIFGAQDSTAAAMAWALYLIGLYPEVQTKIREELDSMFGNDNDRPLQTEDLMKLQYLECVIKECQRLYPSFPFNGRRLLKDFYLCGRKIKKGTTVIVSHYQLHRDPQVFPDPEKFDPDRFLPEVCLRRNPFAYIPFSAGNRSCLGRSLAMVEEKVVLANVLRNFRVNSLEKRDKLRTSVDFVLHSLDPLKVKFTETPSNVTS